MNWMTSAKTRVHRAKKKRTNELRSTASSKLPWAVMNNQVGHQHQNSLPQAPHSRSTQATQAKSAVVKQGQSSDSKQTSCNNIINCTASSHKFYPLLRVQSTCSTIFPGNGRSVLQDHLHQRLHLHRERLPIVMRTPLPLIMRRGRRK
jgi:hypothetical protein